MPIHGDCLSAWAETSIPFGTIPGEAPAHALKWAAREATGRWQEGLYLDVPEAWDYLYRFFRW